MTNAVDRIQEGLKTYDRAKAGKPLFLSKFVSAPHNVARLLSLLKSTELKAAELGIVAQNAINSINTEAEKTRAKFADIGFMDGENGARIDTLGDSRRRQMVDDELHRDKRDILAVSAEVRRTILAELRANRDAVAVNAESLVNSVGLLMSSTLGNKDRNDFAEGLKSSGPVEVKRALETALATGNPNLAAATFVRLEAMPKDSKDLVGVSKSEVATLLMGAQVLAAQQAILSFSIVLADAELINDMAEGTKKTALQRQKLGLMNLERDRLFGDTEEADKIAEKPKDKTEDST